MSEYDATIRLFRVEQLARNLKYWSRKRDKKLVVTADELMAVAKRRMPSINDAELEIVYRIAGAP